MGYEVKNAGDGDVSALVNELGKAFEEFKSTHERELKEIKAKGSSDVVTADKLAKIDEALNTLTEAKAAAEKRADEIEKKLNRPGAGEGVSPEEAEHKKAFGAFMRKGIENGLDAIESKAMSVGSDPDGGYLVPTDTSGRIVTRIFESSPMRQIASVQVIGTDALEGLRDTDEAASGGWVNETGTRNESNAPQLAKWRIPVHEMFAMPAATQQLLDDANVDVEAWLAAKVADKLTRVENAAFVTGDGVGKPRGLFAYDTAATGDASRSWGTFEHIVSGKNGDFADTNPSDKLFDLIGAFKDGYLMNARWVTRREVITKIRKFKESTTGNYLWQPGLQAGQPQTILNFPVTIAQDVPTLATNSISLGFGDVREAYQIVDRQGFRVLRDPFTNKPFVRFYTTRRVGGGAVQFEAFKFLKFGA